MSEPREMWVTVDEDGTYQTVGTTQVSAAIRAEGLMSNETSEITWRELSKLGWTCIPVVVTQKGE